MEINPYQPPAESAAVLAEEPGPASGPAARPVGIWILAGLHLLAGLLFATAAGLFVWQLDRLRGDLMEAFLWFAFVVASIMALIGLSSSVGLWRGARWGWWIASFYYVWAVLGVVADFLVMMSRMSFMDTESIAVVLAGKLVQLVIHALILAYLFKRNVRAFYRLQSLRVDRALVPLVVIAVILLTVTYYVTSVQLANPL